MEIKKVILLTGASSGLGRSAARHLAAEGHTVYGTSRNPGTEDPGFRLIPMDVTDPESVQRGVARVIEEAGRIDVLINNAGYGIGGAIESFSDEEARQQMDTNFLGLFRVTRAVLPVMRNSRCGLIVNISSIGGIMGLPFQGFYSASKFAVEGFSEALAMEVKPWNIKVAVVNPGDFKTGFTSARLLTRADREGSAYKSRVDAAVSKMGADEQGGCNPDLLARTLVRIVRSRNPRYRYIAGRFDQKLIARIRHLLPPRLVRWILSGHYRI